MPIYLTSAKDYEHLDTMSWKVGDKIGCLLHGFFGIFGFKHWMLAVDENYTVIHMIGGNNGNGYIKLQNYRKIDENLFVNNYCVNDGRGVYGENAAQRALSWSRTEPHYYSLLWCNCGHWVDYWADGSANSLDTSCPR